MEPGRENRRYFGLKPGRDGDVSTCCTIGWFYR